jgi:hypothetical protein
MNRWRARLAELQSDASAPSAHVQNVQIVQKSPSVPTFERFERFERWPEPAPTAKNDTGTDAHEERGAIAEYDGGAPRAWAEALARLDPSKPLGDVPPRRWLRFVDDCGHFIDDGWAPCAEALGWTSLDLFGCNRAKPFSRINHAGLLWLLNGRKLLALGPNAATIATASGGKLTFRKCANEPGRVLAWELSREADVQ